MSSWNHRVIETQENGATTMAIHEVHYGADGAPQEYNEPVIVDGLTLRELGEQMASMQMALNMPVLRPQDFLVITPDRVEIIALPVRDLVAA